MGAGDDIEVIVKNSLDFSRLYCNPNAVNDPHMKHMYEPDTVRLWRFNSTGYANSSPIGNGWYYIKITKTKNMVVEEILDSVYVVNSHTYTIEW